jgi:hypothetical protein
VTVNVGLKVPVLVGTPLISPVEAFNVNPAGRGDDDQVNVPVPPVAVNVVL